jgi:hypothetical protein
MKLDPRFVGPTGHALIRTLSIMLRGFDFQVVVDIRGKKYPALVENMPFVPTRYYSPK